MTVAIIYDPKNNTDALLSKMLDFIVQRLLPDRIKLEDVRTLETMPKDDNRHAIMYCLPVPDVTDWTKSGGDESEP